MTKSIDIKFLWLIFSEMGHYADKLRTFGGCDNEGAHIEEDRLHRSALEYIRDYSTDMEARRLAEVVLLTRRLRFARWCA